MDYRNSPTSASGFFCIEVSRIENIFLISVMGVDIFDTLSRRKTYFVAVRCVKTLPRTTTFLNSIFLI